MESDAEVGILHDGQPGRVAAHPPEVTGPAEERLVPEEQPRSPVQRVVGFIIVQSQQPLYVPGCLPESGRVPKLGAP